MKSSIIFTKACDYHPTSIFHPTYQSYSRLNGLSNRHSLPFATPYSDNPSISDELISTIDDNNQTIHTPKHKRQKHNTDTNIQSQSDDLTIEKSHNKNNICNEKTQSSQTNQPKVGFTEDTPVAFENLSKSSKDLHTWHHKLNHMSMTTLQDLARHGSTCQLPKCSACQLGKQR